MVYDVASRLVYCAVVANGIANEFEMTGSWSSDSAKVTIKKKTFGFCDVANHLVYRA